MSIKAVGAPAPKHLFADRMERSYRIPVRSLVFLGDCDVSVTVMRRFSYLESLSLCLFFTGVQEDRQETKEEDQEDR